ncbi:MAG: hypothetical protein BWY68_00373 [bacterium ADurb.Bin400]|nr:MAG: hypothetical protein BWY68_00373 [bacterium ADurb.Bin400]
MHLGGAKKTNRSSKSTNPIDSIGVVFESEQITTGAFSTGFKIPTDDEIKKPKGKSLTNRVKLIKDNRLLKTAKNASAKTKTKARAIVIHGNQRIISIGHAIRKMDFAVRRYRTPSVVILVLFALVFTVFRASASKDKLENLTAITQEQLSASFVALEEGKLVEALHHADKAKESINQLKVMSRAWGQDIRYLRYLPAHNSKLSAYEQFLDSAYIAVNTFSDLQAGFKELIGDKEIIYNNDSIDGLPVVDFVRLHEVVVQLVDQTNEKLDRSKDQLKRAENGLPAELRQKARQSISTIDKLKSSISSTYVLSNKGLPWISGGDGQPKKILILFQNNTELRAGGGFIGSFAVAHLQNGKLSNIRFETNIFKLDKEFTSRVTIAPPEEIAPFFGPKWAMRDSNFDLDFTKSASKVMEFYVMESGEEVDGVIALDTTLFIELLKIVGPIEIPEQNKIIDANNFLSDVQYEVEIAYFARPGGKEENEPKKILSQMMPRFLNKLAMSLQDKDKLARIMEVIGRSLKEKHLLVYLTNSELQQMAENLNYAGKIEHRLTDYLYVSNSNIDGKKSSLNVKESIKHVVNISNSGTISSRLELTRQHNGNGEWPDGVNINLVRILFPDSTDISQMKPLTGNFWPHLDKNFSKEPLYRVGTDSGKTKLTFWQNTEPGQTSKSIVDYTPNYRVNVDADRFTYKLYLQKQPGNIGDDYELELNYPKGFRPVNVKNFDPINCKILIKHFFNQDKEFILEFEKNKDNRLVY